MKNYHLYTSLAYLHGKTPAAPDWEFWRSKDWEVWAWEAFIYKGVRAGAEMDQFLYEDSHYVWDKYQADRYEIVENTPQKA